MEPLGRHWHPSWQIAWSPDARGEHWVRGMTRQAPPRAITIIPPGDVHAPSQQRWVDARSRFMMAYVDEAAFGEFALNLEARPNGTPSFRPGVIENDSELSALYARAHRLSFGTRSLAYDSAWLAFFSRLLTRHATPAFSLPRPGHEPRAVQRALAYVHSRPHEAITLSELARVAGVTPARLCRAFASRVGLPPHAYQLRMRVDHAKQLLLTGRPIAEVAAQTGFADQSHLGRHFKRIVGITPSTYQSARL